MTINIPKIEAFLDGRFIGIDHHVKCIIHAVKAKRNSAFLFHCMIGHSLGNISWYELPLHAFYDGKGTGIPDLSQQEYWDSFTDYVSIHQLDMLTSSTPVLLRPDGNKIEAEYLFTLENFEADPNVLRISFQEIPSENKCFHFLRGKDGLFYLYPNNRILWKTHFWGTDAQFPLEKLVANKQHWSAEVERKIDKSMLFTYENPVL